MKIKGFPITLASILIVLLMNCNGSHNSSNKNIMNEITVNKIIKNFSITRLGIVLQNKLSLPSNNELLAKITLQYQVPYKNFLSYLKKNKSSLYQSLFSRK